MIAWLLYMIGFFAVATCLWDDEIAPALPPRLRPIVPIVAAGWPLYAVVLVVVRLLRKRGNG